MPTSLRDKADFVKLADRLRNTLAKQLQRHRRPVPGEGSELTLDGLSDMVHEITDGQKEWAWTIAEFIADVAGAGW